MMEIFKCYPVSSRRSASASVGPGNGKKRGGQNPMVPSFSVICRDFSEYFEEDVQVYILRLEVATVACLIAVIQYNYSVFACF